MSFPTVASLVVALRQLRLLEPDQLVQLHRQKGAADPKALAKELIRLGWLTPYQVNVLFQGRGKDLVLGQYVLLERLGEGGMGEVFKARHAKLGRVVALKVIRRERVAKEDAVRRFRREIQAVAQLSHPNIVLAFDADEAGDHHFFVMEYVEGTDLAKLVKKGGPLPVRDACLYVQQAALGLQHACERGMVHRDIKPHNLLLTASGGTVKLLDLGLARLVDTGMEDHSGTLTRDQSIMGTPDYIAPEQARDARKADVRSDLYSLGCTLYHLLTGVVPFPEGTLTEKLLQHQLDEPRPVEELRPGVPPGVGAMVRP